MRIYWIIVIGHVVSSFVSSTAAAPLNTEEDRAFWFKSAKQALKDIVNFERNVNVAKNIILFMGDGMGMATITAGRILAGQQHGQSGEEWQLSFDKWPDVGLVKTYNVNNQVGESAAAATAYLCGSKTKKDCICMDVNADETCNPETYLTSILQYAQEAGKSTGFVTTDSVTAASPSPLYARVPDDHFEDDTSIPFNSSCKDIASQLIDNEPGKNIQVIMGGGRKFFLPNTQQDPEDDNEYGRRRDGRNLISEWLHLRKNSGHRHAFVTNLADFDSIDTSLTDYVFGLFGLDKMPFHVEHSTVPVAVPTLQEMTKTAIEILQKNNNGFFLFVENEKIDDGHHAGQAVKPVSEVVQLDAAIQQALDMTDPSDTLIVVTADHSHNMVFSGYPPRGNPIFGLGGISRIDKKPYTTLLYGLSPGFVTGSDGRPNITGIDTGNPEYKQQAVAPRRSGAHAGEDVPMYAIGPWSHLFQGTQEQSYIMHAMTYAACIGNYLDDCHNRAETTTRHRTETTTTISYKDIYPHDDNGLDRGVRGIQCTSALIVICVMLTLTKLLQL